MIFKLKRTAKNVRIIRLCVLDGNYPPLGIYPLVKLSRRYIRESAIFIFAPMHTL